MKPAFLGLMHFSDIRQFSPSLLFLSVFFQVFVLKEETLSMPRP